MVRRTRGRCAPPRVPLKIAPTVHRFCMGTESVHGRSDLGPERGLTGTKIANFGEKVESAPLFHRFY
jgi:hypothetical protein